MTTTQSPATEQPKTASDAGARPYATINPYTGETEKEFPFLDTDPVTQKIVGVWYTSRSTRCSTTARMSRW